MQQLRTIMEKVIQKGGKNEENIKKKSMQKEGCKKKVEKRKLQKESCKKKVVKRKLQKKRDANGQSAAIFNFHNQCNWCNWCNT